MSDEVRVLGIDLASRSWQDNGSAILSFTPGDRSAWRSLECGCIEWPDSALSPTAMAQTIECIVRERRISAVGLDGPQGWREPNAEKRLGVGRVCEYEARCQGKTAEYGKTYPQTQHGWIKFCIDVFSELIKGGNAKIANSPNDAGIDNLELGQYWLLESFPTSTWRASRLVPLPGKSKVRKKRSLLAAYAKSLQQRFGLPGFNMWTGTHDDLQAVVTALPAAGILNGPCIVETRGKPGWLAKATEGLPAHWVEGIIWDATLDEVELAKTVEQPAGVPSSQSDEPQKDCNNPLLVDDRDDASISLLGRGVQLFRYLAQCANGGKALGVSYAQLACCVHGTERFDQITGRDYRPSDTSHVLKLARQITEENGGPIMVTGNGVTIKTSMDAFVWQGTSPHDRHRKAFTDADYTEQEWRSVFPNGTRRLLSTNEWHVVANPKTVDQRSRISEVSQKRHRPQARVIQGVSSKSQHNAQLDNANVLALRSLNASYRHWQYILGDPADVKGDEERFLDVVSTSIRFTGRTTDDLQQARQLYASLARGMNLLKMALEWNDPCVGQQSSETSRLRGLQWRLVIAWSGIEQLSKKLCNLKNPDDFTRFLTILGLPPYHTLEPPNEKLSKLKRWRKKDNGDDALGINGFLQAQSSEAKRVLRKWLITGQPLVSWDEGLSLAKILRHISAHGALSASKIRQWGLTAVLQRLVPDMGFVAASLFGRFVAECQAMYGHQNCEPPVRHERAIHFSTSDAEAILRGRKSYDIRSYPTTLIGCVYVYASHCPQSPDVAIATLKHYGIIDISPNQLVRGMVLGTVELHSCEAEVGSYRWNFRNPKRWKRPRRPKLEVHEPWFPPFIEATSFDQDE